MVFYRTRVGRMIKGLTLVGTLFALLVAAPASFADSTALLASGSAPPAVHWALPTASGLTDEAKGNLTDALGLSACPTGYVATAVASGIVCASMAHQAAAGVQCTGNSVINSNGSNLYCVDACWWGGWHGQVTWIGENDAKCRAGSPDCRPETKHCRQCRDYSCGGQQCTSWQRC